MKKLTTIFKVYVPNKDNQCVPIKVNPILILSNNKKLERRRKLRLARRLKKQKKLDRLKTKKQLYNDYLRSETWRQMRQVILERCQNHCEDCGELCDKLHIHHLTYARFGKEWTTDLQALCITCHEKPEKHPWKSI